MSESEHSEDPKEQRNTKNINEEFIEPKLENRKSSYQWEKTKTKDITKNVTLVGERYESKQLKMTQWWVRLLNAQKQHKMPH